MKVHPAYDVEQQLWFTDNGLEAPTLHELKRKLPKKASIVGYHPSGYRAERPAYKPGDPIRSGLRTNYSGTISTALAKRTDAAVAGKTVVTKKQEEYWAKHKREYEAISSGRVVPRDRGAIKAQPKPTLVSSSVPEEEFTGFAEGGRHAPPPNHTGFWSEKRDQQLLSLVRQRLSAADIAENMSTHERRVTRNAVIGRCHRLGYQLFRKRR